MIDACIAGGDLRRSLSAFREVGERLERLPRAATIFATCVKACMQTKQQGVALELYTGVKDLLICNKVTYNTLMDIFVRRGGMAAATELFRDMTMKNVMPDLITYTTLIKGHCSRGDIEQGLQMFGLMQRRGIKPDAVLFNSILDGCASKQMRTLTEEVLRDMEAACVSPSNFTVSILVKLYGRCGDLEAAFDIVEEYPERYGFQVNTQVFTCLMSACIANGALPRAMALLEGMEARGCTPDARTHQTLLGGCLRASDVAGVSRVLRDALDRGHAPCLEGDFVDAALLLAVRRGHATDVALPLMERLHAAGATMSERTRQAVWRGVRVPSLVAE